MRYPGGMTNAQAVSSPLNNRANETVAANIRGYLGFSGSNQADLARNLGLSEMALSRRMQSNPDFNASEIAAVADYFGIEPGDLFKRANLRAVKVKLPDLDSNQEPAGFTPRPIVRLSDVREHKNLRAG